jgi:hypothetical protein
MTYESFRILITPNVAEPGTWSVEVRECPIANLVGSSDKVVPTFSRAELRSLRNAARWPDDALLRSIGGSVWKTIMSPNVRAAYHASLAMMKAAEKGLRVVFVVAGGEPDGAPPATVRLGEVPVEVLFENAFLASDLRTPVSRSLAISPSYDTRKAPLPLRILVVVATPLDLPQAQMEAERATIENALRPLCEAGTVHLDFCTNATKAKFVQMVGDRYQVVHFIGHGAFDTVADDTTPMPYLCFEREDTHESDPVKSDTLRMQLLNSDVRLVVLTACSSSAPAPADQEPYVHRAFDGIAQSLIGGVSGVPAVVAMQFDLESDAAVVFSRTFYDYLLRTGVSLDEAVTRARIAVATGLGTGHRAWITPTVYWNCTGVPLFDLAPGRGVLDPQQMKDLVPVESQLNALRGVMQKMASRPPEEQQALAPMRQVVLAEIDQLEEERGKIIGDSLRLWGGTAKRGDTVEMKLELRLRLAATVGMVDFLLRFAADKLTFASAAATGGNGMPVAVAPGAPGELRVVIPNASKSQQWAPGRYSLGTLRFTVGAAAEAVTGLQMSNATVEENGVASAFATLDPVIFVE